MFRHGKIAVMCGILLLGLPGCKKEYTCGFSYYYNPAYIAFKGFSADDLGLVVVSRYTANTNFNDLQGVDSIDASGALFEGDTAYNKDNYGFFTIASGVDFRIQVPKTGKEFRITNIRRFESEYSWVQDEHCALGAGQDSVFRPAA